MKRFFLPAALAVCGVASAQTPLLPVTGAKILNAGVPVASGTMKWTPVPVSGVTGFHVGGGGQNSRLAYTANIVNGAIVPLSGVGTFAIPNGALTVPRNMCWDVTVTDGPTHNLLLHYTCVQPSSDAGAAMWCPTVAGATACNFDNYSPALPALPLFGGNSNVTVTQGIPGPAGAVGPAGATGPQGLTGAPGPQGIQGLVGPAGAVGPMGATGPQGLQGIQGLIGPAGPVGQTGAAGAQGLPGAAGPQGVAGVAGPKGDPGATGPQGVAGAASTVPGPQGAAGVAGATGPQGVAGVAGPKGDPGAASTVPGPQGPAGPTGPQGPAGSGGGSASDGSVSASAQNTAPSGQTPNGIANADTAPNQVILIGPGYGAVDATHAVPVQPGSAFLFTKPGYMGLRSTDCLLQQGTYTNPFQSNACSWDHTTFTQQLFGDQSHRRVSLFSYGKSSNYSSVWRRTNLFDEVVQISNRGIADMHRRNFFKAATGDVNLDDTYAWVFGGWKTQSDEGVVGTRNYIQQPMAYFHGTLLAVPGSPTATLSLSDNTASTQGQPYFNSTIDGGILLDISKGTTAYTITGGSSVLPGSGYLLQYAATLAGGGALPLNTAWAYCPTAVALPQQPQVPTSVTLSCQLKLGSFTAGGNIWMAGPNYPEQVPITAVGAVSGTAPNQTQSITITARHPQPTSGLNLIQGPTVGQYISLDAVLSATGQRTTSYNFGSMDGTHLLIGYYSTGGSTALTQCGQSPFCPGVANVDGAHSYPGAEIVSNHSPLHDPELEPNSIPFAVGDLIESPAPDAMQMNGYKAVCGQQTLSNGGHSGCFDLSVYGSGVNGNFRPMYIHNDQNPTMYLQNGGWAFAPSPLLFDGYWDSGITYNIMPGHALRTVLNMAYNRFQGGTAILDQMPSGQTSWDDTNRRFLAPSFGGDGSQLTGITAGQVGADPAGAATAAQAAAIAAAATTSSNASNLSSGVVPLPQIPTIPFSKVATQPSDLYAVFAQDPIPSYFRYREGTGPQAGTVNAAPPAGQAQTELCKDANGHATLDANNLAQVCVRKSDGSSTPIGAPPPPLTWAAINAVYLASPNCALTGHTDSDWLRTGNCTLPPGSPASFVASANGGYGNNSVTYKVQFAGSLVMLHFYAFADGNSAPGPIAAHTVTESTGASGTQIGDYSTYNSSYNQTFEEYVYAFPNMTTGNHTFSVSYGAAIHGTRQPIVAEWQNAALTNPTEATTSGATCSAVTTTGTNERVVYMTSSGQPTSGTQDYSSEITETSVLVPTATTVAAPPMNGAALTCVSFAIKHP